MLHCPYQPFLHAIRLLAEVRMYAGLHVVTPLRLAKARKARDEFAHLMTVSSTEMLLTQNH